MTDETMIEPKQADGFKTESPIRAFTDFQIAGSYAIGKGFRPSLAHLSRYLDAMLAKEGWGLLQVILPRDGDGDPTMIFEKSLPSFEDLGLETLTEIERPGGRPTFVQSSEREPFRPGVHGGGYKIRGKCDWPMVKDFLKDQGVTLATDGMTMRLIQQIAPNVGEDPINPAYYDGKACAEIIEYMPFNVGVAGKYVWRLGEKDSEEQECGKAAWYLKREIVLHAQGIAPRPVFGLSTGPEMVGIPKHGNVHWYQKMAGDRIEARKLPGWRAQIMRNLVCYTTTGQASFLESSIGALECQGDGCTEYGRGLEA